MKRVITASTGKGNRTFIAEPSWPNYETVEGLLSFNPDEIIELLLQIRELSGLKIFYEFTSAGKMALYVGENVYTISKDE